MNLLKCLESGDESCDGVSTNEVAHVKAWRAFSTEYTKGNRIMPVTALLVGLHNMITESVPSSWISDTRRHFYCPVTVLQQLKVGMFAHDEKVQAYVSPIWNPVPGVPGLGKTPQLRDVHCHKAPKVE